MIDIKRLFLSTNAKGTKNYLNTQKKYEIARTVLYFSISIILFVAGYIQTKERVNLLSVVAALGCLPASKSAVIAIMFCRYKSLDNETAQKIEAKVSGLTGLYDMVFTSDKKNYVVNHLVICDNTICGFSQIMSFPEKEFNGHLEEILKLDGYTNVTIKIFTDLSKYLQRLEQLQDKAGEDAKKNEQIAKTLKNVSL